MKAEGSIVPCASAEQEGWLSLRRQLWPHHPPDTLLTEMATFCSAPGRFGQYLFLSAQGEAVGFVEVSLRVDHVNGTSTSPVAFLEGIFVSPSVRRRGIARALVAKAAEWAQSHGCREFVFDALLENQVSHTMRRALGLASRNRQI